MKRTSALAALAALALAGAAFAQGVVLAEATRMTAIIQKIDPKTREITLKTDAGKIVDIVAGEEVKRFNELKVGDKVTIRYQAAAIFKLHTSDKPLSPPVRTESTTRITEGSPGGTMSVEETAVVSVEAIDAEHSTITVKTFDGQTADFLVENKENLKTVKPGDRIEVTYREAVAIDVESPAKPAAGAVKPAGTEHK
jgi:Cu/Ag efflux protein CusF